MLKIIQISDLPSDAAPAFSTSVAIHGRGRRRAIAGINAEHADANLAVFAGDLAALGQAAAYQQLSECLVELRLSFGFASATAIIARASGCFFPMCRPTKSGFTKYAVQIDGLHMVFLDTMAAIGANLAMPACYGCAINSMEIGDAPFALGILLLDSLALRGS
ncbi:hypothetical protein H8A97_03665 [Bradyrhizobium sp. Arg62]|uniref:hypothetical protein n=1 Tax=Bradyrhizobium brasilense TaxID=1419277 RepID=UPI001E2B6BCA|nr:hypothetical protein [Bradyrhizobium brasilense]MCC8944221.1 hypothetical protein [Bradyrhizobium brasilense]